MREDDPRALFAEKCKIICTFRKNVVPFAADFNSDSLTMEDRQEQNSSGMMHIADLQQAVQVIKGAIQRSQARSLQHVNNEVLYF